MRSRLLAWLAAAAAAAITTATPAVALAAPPPQPGTAGPSGTASPLTANQPADAPPRHMQPLWRRADDRSGQGTSPDTIGEPGGYDPDALRAYLHLNGTGQGQTVAIVEAWDVSESLRNALTAYNNWYGLKPACSDTVTTGCFPLTIVAPDGTREPDTNNNSNFNEAGRAISWQKEADLDAEAVHAIAPDAAITVVEARDDSDDAVMAALGYAASVHPAVISNSYGEDEFDGEQGHDGLCQATGAMCVFSSGDTGNPGQYPAANPDVLAVGGTTLDADRSGQVRSEVAWPGSGGGVSPFEQQPTYQAALDPFPGGRGLPDVSFDADPNSGVATYLVLTNPIPTQSPDFCEVTQHQLCGVEGWAEFGGTSVGAPAWAAILAATGQQRADKGKAPLTADQVHAAVYSKANGVKGLADITSGNNGFCGPVCSAGPGYDLVTGRGSPRPGIDTYLAKQH